MTRTKLAAEVVVGDVLDVNTGYRPLDDEACLVLAVEHGSGLFGDAEIRFLIQTYEDDHWWCVPAGCNVPLSSTVVRRRKCRCKHRSY